MKNLFLTMATLLLFTVAAFAQSIDENDGLYYKDGLLYSGTLTECYENGILKIEINLFEGQKHDLTFIYFPDGSKKEQRSYKQGVKHGTWYTWDENSKLTAEANFKDGEKHGSWLVWDSNGNKRYQIYYENGEKSGDWFMWDEEGNLAMERKY